MENKTYYKGQVLWSQIDANRHLRHSAYADICTQARCNMMNEIGFSVDQCAELGIGPILFREEIIFFKEIKIDEWVSVEIELIKWNAENHRFSFRHTLYNSNYNKSAVVTIDGAWMDLKERKLTVLPMNIEQLLEKMPKSVDFELVKI